MIRDARRDDVPASAAIWSPIIRDTTITFWPTERSAAGNGDGVQGFATYGPFRPGGGYARSQEHTLYLAPDARGAGSGRHLPAWL